MEEFVVLDEKDHTVGLTMTVIQGFVEIHGDHMVVRAEKLMPIVQTIVIVKVSIVIIMLVETYNTPYLEISAIFFKKKIIQETC